ncbi:MAG: hypothetical protein HY434_01870 [Candidatus Liptonbacteria bacterium]|nr:hypothetical protein [Candidatus Liptonbacteria bacterium]
MINWLPEVFFGLLLLFGGYRYIARRGVAENLLRGDLKKMILLALAFYVCYPVLLTAHQYYAWLGDPLGKTLLNLPLSDNVPAPWFLKASPFLQSHLGYFLFYSYGRFWLNSILAVAAAALFYFFLQFLRKRQDRFFEAGETEFGFLAALIAGWPAFVVFVPAVFVSVVVVAAARLLFFRERYTTLGYSFIAAAAAALLFGSWLISSFRLSFLYI